MIFSQCHLSGIYQSFSPVAQGNNAQAAIIFIVRIYLNNMRFSTPLTIAQLNIQTCSNMLLINGIVIARLVLSA
jgi:hypothetical protein